MDRLQIERHAYNALIACGLQTPPFDPAAVANHFGALVIEQPADSSESGFCLRQDGHNIIGVNSNHHQNRRRFTVAHEVGHLLLHQGRALTVDKVVRIRYRNEVSSMATDLEEIQANAFAAALLMPESHVRHEVPQLLNAGNSEASIVEILSSRYGVSTQAMSYRLLNLGIFLG